MKTLLLFGAIALSINSFAQASVKIGNLEVMTEDLGELTMNWDDAMKACAALGDGWRLPTKDELNILYENKDKIGGFGNDDYWNYWSSTENDYSSAWLQNFYDGSEPNFGNMPPLGNVRAIRGSYEEGTVEISTKTVKIGDLEIMTEDLGEMNWYDADKACTNLGDGWRLPTYNELEYLCGIKDEIGGFIEDTYWCIEGGYEEGFELGVGFPFCESNPLEPYSKSFELKVRAVRSI